MKTELDRSIPENLVAVLEKGTNGTLRIGQYILIFQQWCHEEKNINDIFYIENNELVRLMEEFNNNRYDVGCSC